MNLNKINKLCKKLLEEEGTITIHGDDYQIDNVIEFALKYDPTVITLYDAKKTIQKMNLFNELKRVVRDRDKSLDYYNSKGVF